MRNIRLDRTTQANVGRLQASVEKHPTELPKNTRKKAKADAEWVFVTPEKAVEMLKANVDNYRNLREKKVLEYAYTMEEGNWKKNACPIQFNKKGELIDGQHRLHAVTMADKIDGIWFLVVENVEDAEGIDEGMNRSLSDRLRADGFTDTNSRDAASALRLLWQLEYGRYSKKPGPKHRPSHDRLVAYLEDDHPYLIDSVVPGSVQTFLPKAISVSMHYLFSMRDPDMANDFINSLKKRDEDQLETGDPVRTLRDKLINDATKRNTSMKQEAKIIYCIIAWNNWMNGNFSVRTLRYEGDGIPKIKGRIKKRKPAEEA